MANPTLTDIQEQLDHIQDMLEGIIAALVMSVPEDNKSETQAIRAALTRFLRGR